jgi:hypothetical protein
MARKVSLTRESSHQVTPEVKRSKLALLTAQKVVSPNANLKRAGRELLKEMKARWEKKLVGAVIH